MKLDHLVNMYEMYNFHANISWSTGDKDRIIGMFEIEGAVFRILLEPGYYRSPALNHTYTFLNVAFSRYVDGRDVFNLTSGGPFLSKVLGTVKYGIEQKTDLFNQFDAVVFVARDNQEKRMSVYNKFARVWAKNFGTIAENVQTETGPIMTIIMKNSETVEGKQFFEYLKTQNKN